jgi:hypothetical protein
MNSNWLLAVTGALLSTGALAQTTPPASPHSATAAASLAAPIASSKASLREQLMTDIQKAGFTDVVVKPDSVLVRAKDKNGTPVTMLIDPDSVTEIVGTGGVTAGSDAASPTNNFVTVAASDMLSAKVVGTKVNNNANVDIGTIKDVAYSGSNIKAYIVGVGGFLGMGDHYVAVTPSAINVNYDAGSRSWHATMNATAEQLKAAPGFKYPG